MSHNGNSSRWGAPGQALLYRCIKQKNSGRPKASPYNRVGGGIAPAALSHHRTYSSYPAVAMFVGTATIFPQAIAIHCP